MKTHPTNQTLRYVERVGARDRYGEASRTILYSQIRGFFEKRPRTERDVSGDIIALDAELVLTPRYTLQAGDKITLENADGDEYLVFSVDDSLDIHGSIRFRTYALTKQRKNP